MCCLLICKRKWLGLSGSDIEKQDHHPISSQLSSSELNFSIAGIGTPTKISLRIHGAPFVHKVLPYPMQSPC